MEVKYFVFFVFPGFIVTSYLYWSVQASCSIEDRVNQCIYTVTCYNFAGSVNNPGCNGSPNVTFIIRSSTTISLTTGFFSSTNFDSRVRSFIATNNDWIMIEKQALKYYRHSTFVDMAHNNLQVIENYAFLDLTQMKYLNLSHNRIDTLFNRSLQVSETSSGVLEILDLSHNNLAMLDNNVFSNFPFLQELYLQHNQIKILYDACFYNLRSLKRLIMSNNIISSTNLTLVPLNELIFLDLSFNKINKLLGLELRLVSLVNLNISYNDMESIDYNCFSQSFKLEILDLSHNRIHSTLEKVMFVNNHNLSYIDFYDNNLTIVGDSVFKFNHIHYLNIERNHISGAITNSTFSGLGNITSLNITHQNIEVIKNNAFSEMTNMVYLNLSNNIIKTIENSSFVNASSLSVLDVSYNQIHSLYFLKMFASNLTEMYIQNNNLMIIPEKVFKNHSRLKKLDISENIIINIDQNALPLSNLQFLDLNKNNLSGMVLGNVFSPAKLLRYLDLSNFCLEKLNDSAIVEMPLVAWVNISHNKLIYIHPNNFKGVEKMFSLDISHNNLTDLNLDNNLNNLQAIYLNSNRFFSIPKIFGNESKLQYLDISFNNISNVTDATFKNISQLKVLHMSNNQIEYFNNDFTNSLANLSELSLASNHIKEMINITFFKVLQSVNLSNNEIDYVDHSQFQNLNSLQLLSLSGNKIKTLPPGTFQQLKSLILLDISSNYITDIRFGSFRGLNSTSIINLSYNKLKFINVEVFHECFDLKTLIIDYNNISNIDVEKMAVAAPKLELLSLGGNPIACEEIVRSKRISKLFITRVVITSLHKVYHEDNVHGIKCGNNQNNMSMETTTVKVAESKEIIYGSPHSIILYVWCGVLSVLLLTGVAIYAYRRRNKRLTVNRESRMQFQNSADIANSECYSDLLN